MCPGLCLGLFVGCEVGGGRLEAEGVVGKGSPWTVLMGNRDVTGSLAFAARMGGDDAGGEEGWRRSLTSPKRTGLLVSDYVKRGERDASWNRREPWR